MNRWLQIGSIKRKPTITGDQEASCSSEPTSLTSCCSADLRKVKRRKYSEEYLSFGFVRAGTEDEQKPQCVLCYDVLSNDAMKPAKLRRHLETKHPDCIGKTLDYFKIKSKEMKMSKSRIEKISTGTSSEKATLASYEVALLIAKSGKPYNIAEELILPAAKKMCSIMIGDSAAKELNTVPLSNDSVKRRIVDMSQNVLDQLIMRLKSTTMYALQLDESTDFTDKSHLLAFVRYEHEKELVEDLLFCREVLHNTAEDVFKTLDGFISEQGLEWKVCVGVSTDGAAAMSGHNTGLKARVQAVNPEIKWTHCSIHREALAVKKIPPDLKETLEELVKIVNYIKARPLNARIFKKLCEEMGSEHKQLFLHTNVRWLSYGNVLSRFFELRDEVRLFFEDSKHEMFPLSERLCDFEWLCKVAYLASIFSHLNELNRKLQGPKPDVFTVHEKIEAMIGKLQVWKGRVEKKSLGSFPILEQFLTSSEETLPKNIEEAIVEHLNGLSKTLRKYFPAPADDQNEWIKYPFQKKDIGSIDSLSEKEQDQLIELFNSKGWKVVYQENELAKFWFLAQSEFNELATKALKYIVPFPTTYLCEQTFSVLCNIKPLKRNRLANVETDLRVKNTNIKPSLTELIQSKKQLHCSH